jgi:Zn-dependent peptidase ImmA (M78 family)/DNA-binding XRE family transcriptional regulator
MAPSLNFKGINWTQVGERLQTARKEANFTQQDVAERLEMARTTVVAIEKGERRVSQEELITLADLYGIDLNALLRNKPILEPLSVQFKAFFKNPLLKDHEENELQSAANQLQKYCEQYLELEQIVNAPLPRRYPLEYEYKGLPVESAADEIASQERTRLGLGDGPIKDLRGLLETEVGLRIFYLQLPSWMSGLFGFTEDLGGCIAINSKHPTERRRISLAHEYCHFLTNRHRPDVHVTRSYTRVPESEKLAEGFARRFIMPESGMRKHLRSHLQNTGHNNLSIADLVYLAQYYNVSLEAYVRRLEEMGAIGLGVYEKLKDDKFQVRKAQAVLGIDPTNEENEMKFPSYYKRLAVSAFVMGEITEKQLSDYLETNRLEAREIVEQLSGQVVLDEEGNPLWMPWSVDEKIAVRV